MRFGKAVPASDVARETLDALGRRRQTVPGGLSKLLYASLMTAPRSLRVRIMKRVMASMT
jgi:short-subunit dehydrogenase